MQLTTTWEKATITSGLGAIIQRHSLDKVLVAYSVSAPTTGSFYVLRTYEPETFSDTQVGDFIWVRAETSTSFVTVEEVDLSGGSTSSPNGGFMDYNDTASAASPIVLPTDTWTRLTNDGLGSFTNKTYKPSGVTELMDSSGNIDCSELVLGDYILIRNDYTVTPSGNNQKLKFRYTLGTGGVAYTLEKTMGRLDEGGNIPYRFSLELDEVYMGDSATRDNLIGIEIKTSGAGTVVNSGTVISVVKRVV